MITYKDLDVAYDALLHAEWQIDKNIIWNAKARAEYLAMIRHARRSVLKQMRRKRKAAKNIEMYKTFGSRPWHVELIGNGAELEPHAWDALTEPHCCTWRNEDGVDEVVTNYRCALERRGPHLVQPNGFRSMSFVADVIKHGGLGIKSCQELSNEIWSGII